MKKNSLSWILCACSFGVLALTSFQNVGHSNGPDHCRTLSAQDTDPLQTVGTDFLQAVIQQHNAVTQGISDHGVILVSENNTNTLHIGWNACSSKSPCSFRPGLRNTDEQGGFEKKQQDFFSKLIQEELFQNVGTIALQEVTPDMLNWLKSLTAAQGLLKNFQVLGTAPATPNFSTVLLANENIYDLKNATSANSEPFNELTGYKPFSSSKQTGTVGYTLPRKDRKTGLTVFASHLPWQPDAQELSAVLEKQCKTAETNRGNFLFMADANSRLSKSDGSCDFFSPTDNSWSFGNGQFHATTNDLVAGTKDQFCIVYNTVTPEEIVVQNHSGLTEAFNALSLQEQKLLKTLDKGSGSTDLTTRLAENMIAFSETSDSTAHYFSAALQALDAKNCLKSAAQKTVSTASLKSELDKIHISKVLSGLFYTDTPVLPVSEETQAQLDGLSMSDRIMTHMLQRSMHPFQYNWIQSLENFLKSLKQEHESISGQKVSYTNAHTAVCSILKEYGWKEGKTAATMTPGLALHVLGNLPSMPKIAVQLPENVTQEALTYINQGSEMKARWVISNAVDTGLKQEKLWAKEFVSQIERDQLPAFPPFYKQDAVLVYLDAIGGASQLLQKQDDSGSSAIKQN